MASRSLLPRLTQRRTTTAFRARPESGPGTTGPGIHQHRGRSRLFTSAVAAAASHASSRTQIYISRTTDPLANLSLEHRLLQTSHPDSTVLVLYVNRPTVVFGRNQNPWLEVNLAKLSAAGVSAAGSRRAVGLLRRRSGGGTVFHDEGNVNFGVICPPAAFDRDRHAEMVARALRRLGQPTARVNERHDIVIDVDGNGTLDGKGQASNKKETRKVSGSAYKLTRLRSLHHGTCLVDSPNLGLISPLLRSPAEPYVKARGVDSVRSPVANAGGPGLFGVDEFRDAVAREFEAAHGVADVKEEFGDEVLLLPPDGGEGEGAGGGGGTAVADGARELGSRDWLYGQTPRFTFSTAPTGDDPRERPGEAEQRGVFFEAKRGVIDRFELDGVSQEKFLGRSLCDVDWASSLAGYHSQGRGAAETGEWMDAIMGTAFTRV
ncbi:hypothetical protein N3K66_003903 [Trichothecium roseum]|uniref:Uncharacterized protein n=1 Tax=Trichothecium roseum TaxID=47278 RepID=A0ACC0V6Q9_9HYPO|nr:hypothetical protein N3K66_003903 [Trichothecium roseum]